MNLRTLHFRPPRSAVLRLTMWYTLIIMVISFFFSAIIYQINASHFRVAFPPRQRFSQEFGIRFRPYEDVVENFFEERYQEMVERLRLSLLVLNVVVLGGAAVASYFLAKRTLRPIERALEEQRRFTADASHELRTPLAAMRAEIDVTLRDRGKADHVAVLKSNLEEIQKLEKLSGGLLQLARNENGKGSGIREAVTIADVVEDAVNRVAPVAQKKEIVIERSGIGGAVAGDRTNLTELIVVLLDNAIKYSADKSVVRIEGSIQKKNVQLRVIDRGIGIPPDDLPHVFERFYRADASRSKHKTNGFGLGLSIAKQIVDKHHGTIRLESEVGKGTTVTVTLPLVST